MSNQAQTSQSKPIPTTSDLLACIEDIDGRRSPDLWPELMPGLNDFTRKLDSNDLKSGHSQSTKLRTDLDSDDVRLVQELGQLSADQLMEHIRKLQSDAYQLGLEEAKQAGRGKLLHIFEKSSSSTAS